MAKLTREQRSINAKKGHAKKRAREELETKRKEVAKAKQKKLIAETELPNLIPVKRRKTRVDRELEKLQLELELAKKQLKEQKITHDQVISASDRLLTKLMQQQAATEKQLEQRVKFEGFVPALDAQWLHGWAGKEGSRKHGTIALTPSSLRHLEESESLWEILDKYRAGDPNELREYAEYVAEQYDVDVKEVYNFIYSP